MSRSAPRTSAITRRRRSNDERQQRAQTRTELAAAAPTIADGDASCRAVCIIDREGAPRSLPWEYAVAEFWPSARVLRRAVPPRVSRADLQSVHLELAAFGPFDVVIDLSRSFPVPRLLPELLYSLRPGGRFLGVGRLAPAGHPPTRFQQFLTDVLEHDPPRGTLSLPDLAAFAASVDTVEQDGCNAVLVKRGETLAKIRPRDGDRLLELRPSVGRVLRTVPGGAYDVTVQLAASRPAYLERLPGLITAPGLSVREYDDVLVAARQVVVSGHLVLPDTYRHHGQDQPGNRRLTDYSPGWAGPLTLRKRVVERPGAWFYLDNVYRGHFGHALTDVVSHLWAWSEARERHPGLKAMMFVNRGRGIAQWERLLLAAGGVPPVALALFKRPQRVETLVACSPMFSAPQYVHPGIEATFRAIGTSLATGAADTERPRRIFCSRRERKRRCRNAPEVEAFFGARGFTVVHPEDHPLPEQIRLFRSAEVIAGYAGSAMFQLAFTGTPKTVISVTSEGYPMANEVLIAAVVGHRISIAVCDCDAPPASRGRPVPPYKSDFTFDLVREGAYVDDVLANL